MVNIHLKTAGDHIRRSPFQAAAAVFVLAVTFFVVTFLAVLTHSSDQVIKYFETRPQVIAFLKDNAKSEDISALKAKLEADTRVDSVSYVSKEQALEIYKKATSDNPLLSELVSPSIFPASLEFSLVDLYHAQAVIDEVKGDAIVDQVGYTASLGDDESLNDVVTRLRNLTWYLGLGGGAFAFFLVLYSTPSLIGYFGDVPVLPRNTMQLFWLFGSILAIELIAGLILAVSGSILAVSRVKRKK